MTDQRGLPEPDHHCSDDCFIRCGKCDRSFCLINDGVHSLDSVYTCDDCYEDEQTKKKEEKAYEDKWKKKNCDKSGELY